jgi:threonyl-tRNA synthetase
MDQIHVTLPDGSVKDVPKGTTPLDIAKSISPRLGDAALVAKVFATDTNGVKEKSGIFSNSVDPAEDGSLLFDLRRPIDQDVKLQILTEKDPDALYVFRHSAAHLLAAAVMELYPAVKLGIGPPVENGFFYEFLRDQPFVPEDLEKNRKEDARARRQGFTQRAQASSQGRSSQVLSGLQATLQMRADSGKSR